MSSRQAFSLRNFARRVFSRPAWQNGAPASVVRPLSRARLPAQEAAAAALHSGHRRGCRLHPGGFCAGVRCRTGWSPGLRDMALRRLALPVRALPHPAAPGRASPYWLPWGRSHPGCCCAQQGVRPGAGRCCFWSEKKASRTVGSAAPFRWWQVCWCEVGPCCSFKSSLAPGFVGPYSETRVNVSRNCCVEVVATPKERRPCAKLTGAH